MALPDTFPEVGFIEVRSKKQAFDWGLVLASQGIDFIINKSEDDSRWVIEVNLPDLTRAVNAIELYERENPEVTKENYSKLGLNELFHPATFFWAIIIIAFFFVNAAMSDWLKSIGSVDSVLVVSGQWWRLVTANYLHFDAAHLVSNLSIGLLFMGLAMARYGPGLVLFLTLVSGSVGNLLSIIVDIQPHVGLGASGCVMSAIGLVATESFPDEFRSQIALRMAARSILCGIFLFALFGLNPESDVWAHLGGFMSGMVCGIWLNCRTCINQYKTLRLRDPLFLILWFLLVSGCWFSAIVFGENPNL